MKEDFIVTCSVHILHFRLMQILGRYQLHCLHIYEKFLPFISFAVYALSIFGSIRFSAAIAEMLVQSTMDDLYLLPALPRDKWANGSVSGLKARGGLTVSISWREGDLHEVSLWSKDQNTPSIRLHYRGITVTTTKLLSSRAYTFDKQLKFLNSYAV